MESTSAADAGARSVISVWKVSLARRELDVAWSDLDDTERQRAARYAFGRDRRRFVLARSALRRILGQRLRITPAKLTFELGTAGKPFLREHRDLGFNVSHSADVALIAVANQPAAIGVDIERRHNLQNAGELAGDICSREQADAIAASSNASLAFLRVWTRKEAASKALGFGVGSIDLRAFDAGLDGESLSVLSGAHVAVMPLQVGHDHVASIAQVATQVPVIEMADASNALWPHSI
ncbi:MAG: 4'-phosphopantetheinyl transferase superfamily protein [Pseudomonadota bacterium]|nr:4'-phosphopantetheinyl transferase superfamily protein [Burkholderiaceae bacterium]MDQ3446756.1 4'-phosphopantetheinyl transferase superfamily protein [Pseudomonadota bacterium]